MEYDIVLTRAAEEMLASIDTAGRRKIGGRIDDLQVNAEAQGKALVDELSTYRSVRAGQRYRIIYRILDPQHEGERPIYKLATRMYRNGEL